MQILIKLNCICIVTCFDTFGYAFSLKIFDFDIRFVNIHSHLHWKINKLVAKKSEKNRK